MDNPHNNLINLCKKGDRKAQTQLYAAFYRKNYIKENRAVFDDREPAEDHFDRFEERLNRLALEKQSKHPVKFRIITVFSVAASVFLIAMAVFWPCLGSMRRRIFLRELRKNLSQESMK